MPSSVLNVFSLSECENLKKLLKNPKEDFQEILSLLETKVEKSNKQFRELDEKYHSLIDGLTHVGVGIDIVKKTEDAFLEERKFTETALNAQRDTFFVFEPSTGKAIRWNKAFSEISGYNDREISTLKAPESYYSKNDLESISEADKLIEKGGTAITELTLITKEKKIIPFEYAASGIFDDDNNLKYIVAIGRNITERKQIEEILYSERDLIRTLLENHLDFIYFKDSEARFQHISKRFSELFGRSMEDIIGKTDLELFPEELAKQTHSEDLHVIKTGIPLINKEESTAGTWVLTTKIPWIDNEGNIKGLFGISRDITKRKKAEQKLKESEQRYRGLINNITDIIFELNINGKCTYVSKQLFKMSGFHPEEMIGKNVFNYLHPEDLLNVTENVKEAFQKGIRISTDFRLRHKDGFYVSVSSNFNVIRIAGEQRFIGVLRDNTEKKQAEINLKESEEKYRALFDNSPIGIGLSTLEGEALDSNDAMIELTGFTAEDLNKIGTPSIYVDPNVRSKILKVLQEDRQLHDYEVKLRRKDNTELFGSISFDLIELGGKKIIQTSLRDITERKKAEEKLIESEENFRTIAEQAFMGIEIIQDGKIKYVNEAASKILEFSTQEIKEWEYEDLFKFVYPEDLPIIYEQQKKRLEEKEPQIQYSVRAITKSGKIKWLDISSKIVLYRGKEATFAIFYDITDTKKAEQKLKDSEENFRTITEESHLAITILQDDLVVYTNQKMADMFGYEREEMLKWTPKEYAKTMAEDSLEFVMEQARKKQIGDPDVIAQYPIHCVKSSGEKFWVDNISTTIIYNGHPADLVTIVDITDNREAQQKIKESEEKFRTIAEQSLIGISIVQDNIIKYVNNKMSDILGYSVNEIMNWTPEEYINTIHPDYRGSILEQAKDKQKGLDYEVVNYQFQVITKSGDIVWVENYLREIKFEGRSADLIIYIDITDKKEVEQELLKLNNLKSELLRRTSHELKTPLVSIKGFSELLLQVHRDKLDALVISTLNEIKQGCLRLENLIGDILKTAELESGTIQLHKSEEDLSFLVKLCVNEIKGLSTLRGHRISLELHDNLITQFEKEQIHQVIGNLLNNAVKYTPPSGLIEIKSEIRDGFIVLSIKDNGMGFTEEEKSRIFKQFGKIERYGQGMDIIPEGSGFGLFISKKIVELHGGDIWVESDGRNKGSTFYFSLPLI